MAIAKDEAWGLLIACSIGASALGLFTYRQLQKPSAQEAAIAEAEEETATPALRDAFAEALEIAFVEDGTDAAVFAKDTRLEIAWFPCSKVMLDRLLRRKNDALTKKVRDASGLSIAKLKTLGFTQVVCDNTRGAKATDDLSARKKR
ncbi:MAG: hypothetical protein M4D80_20355 [Myxococcota bacterium]|nr:hypothetical protein [Myxococcota bacterium]